MTMAFFQVGYKPAKANKNATPSSSIGEKRKIDERKGSMVGLNTFIS